ncbi:hypothetical protein ACR2R6_13720 [Methylocaldum gracile subsp. desertum]|jgi:hypothetical protein|uniref:hypothetical protein n=1 Tax=Methylocaldum sp. GT1BW TaxID=3438964 RepID=UPI0010D78A0C
MVEIHPVEHVGPLPAANKVKGDENRKQQKPDSKEKKKPGPASDDSLPHIDEYA